MSGRATDPGSDDVELIDRDGFLEARYLDQMERSIRACEERGRTLLLVDITDLQGYRPTTFDRHKIGVTGASLSRGLAKVEALVKPEQLDDSAAKLGPPSSESFATTVARNRGLEIRSFLVRAEAVDWLTRPA